eukprot:703708-Amphidinium_carterae.3
MPCQALLGLPARLSDHCWDAKCPSLAYSFAPHAAAEYEACPYLSVVSDSKAMPSRVRVTKKARTGQPLPHGDLHRRSSSAAPTKAMRQISLSTILPVITASSYWHGANGPDRRHTCLLHEDHRVDGTSCSA